MIVIDIPENEYYDSVTEMFITIPAKRVKLEHSLVAISKWESKWLKPFLGPGDKTMEQKLDYISFMILDEDEPTSIVNMMTESNLKSIIDYIESPMTATTIKQSKSSKVSREIITSELIYYWMISFNIPFECEYWHLNRLLMLINVCNVKNTPPKKASTKDILTRNRELNAARRKALGTSG